MISKQRLTTELLILRRLALTGISFDRLRQGLEDGDFEAADVDLILSTFGDRIQNEINNLDARIRRREEKHDEET